jgi:hypothetical protein
MELYAHLVLKVVATVMVLIVYHVGLPILVAIFLVELTLENA